MSDGIANTAMALLGFAIFCVASLTLIGGLTLRCFSMLWKEFVTTSKMIKE